MKIWEIIGRIAYIVTLPAIMVYAASSRPRTRMLIMVEDEVLVVKNWLGQGHWSLPGGGAHKHENPLDAVLREVTEELSVVVDPATVQSLGYHVSSETSLLRSKYELFAVELQEKPILTLQRLEIMDSRWIKIADARHDPTCAATVRDSLQVWLKSRNLV